MHFSNFDFSATQILWTLTFAALLVLLVVLLGRDRAKRFPWFTASIVTMGLLKLTEQLLLTRLPRITGLEVYWSLSNLNVVIGLIVLVELARQSFRGARKLGWIIGTLAVLAGGVAAIVLWGPWPAWLTLTAQSQFAAIRVMQFAVDKGSLLTEVLTIELGLLVTLLARRFGGGWHSHAQRILVGLSTLALDQLIMRGIFQAISTHSVIHSQAEYDRLLGLRDKLIHANDVVYLCVVLWWIACLWIDEPAEPGAAQDPDSEAETDAEATAEAKGETESTESPDAFENLDLQDESDGTHLPN